MTTFEQSDWTATIVAAGTSGTIRKSPDPSSSREGAGPPDYAYSGNRCGRKSKGDEKLLIDLEWPSYDNGSTNYYI